MKTQISFTLHGKTFVREYDTFQEADKMLSLIEVFGGTGELTLTGNIYQANQNLTI